MNYYISVLQNYATFTGRARRAEYWMFTLVNIIIAVILSALVAIADVLSILYVLYSLAVFVPSIAVGVRRLHDIGKSGWFILLGFIPLVGAIILIIMFCMDSQPGDNEYGANPKETAKATVV